MQSLQVASNSYAKSNRFSTCVFRQNVNQILWFALLFPHLKPTFFNQVAWLDISFNVLRMVSGLVILFIYVRMKKVTSIVILLGVFEIIRFLSTALNGLEFRTILLKSASSVCMVLLTDYILQKDPKNAIKVLAFGTNLIVYANFATEVLFPLGLYESHPYYFGGSRKLYLIGHQNLQILYIMVSICFSWLRVLLAKDEIRAKLSFVFLLTVSTTSLLVAWSATPFVIYCIFIILLIFSKPLISARILSMKSAILIICAFFVLIPVLRIHNYFEFFITNILNRSITLSTRTILWDELFIHIKANWLLGNGVADSNEWLQRFGGSVFVHAHNQIMQILYEGGTLLTIVFMLILFVLASRIDKNRDFFTLALMVPFLSLSVGLVSEQYFTQIPLAMLLFVIGFHLDKIRAAVPTGAEKSTSGVPPTRSQYLRRRMKHGL